MNNAIIKRVTITNVEIAVNIERSDEFKLGVRTESQICPPKSKENKTVLYKIKADISIPESEELKIVANAEIIFEFDEVPTDYDKIGGTVCLSLAQEEILKKIGDIMEIMGYNRFNIEIPKE